MNSITKEYENFSRKVIEHARGSNDRFETGLLLLLVWCGQNFVPFAPQTTAHLLLRRFAFFFQKVLFAPGCRVMQAALAPAPVVDSRPDAAAALTQPKICLFNMLSPLLLCILTHHQPQFTTLDCSVGILREERSCAPI